MSNYEYTNTRDLLGDDATLAGLVMDTLTEFVEDGVTTVTNNAFYRKTTLQTIRLPNLGSIASSQFYYCSGLKHLLLDYNGVIRYNASAFSDTPIAAGEGAVYVPEDQVDNYKNNSSWKSSGIMIVPIDDYPLTAFDTIKDDWDTILSSDGSAYSIGDTKTLTLTDGSAYKMQIIYKGEGGSILTWLGKNIRENYKMNSTATTSGGWEGCELRIYIRGDGFYNKVPTSIQNHIVAVDKTYSDYTSGSKVVKSCSDTVWIPSSHEMYGDATYEDTGVDYTEFFRSNSARIKYRNNAAGYWWLRSAVNDSVFRCVSNSGSNSNYGASANYGLVIGFCTGN